MPIYEYKCKKCGKAFEVLVRASEKPSCPSCGSKSLKKLVSGFAAVSEKSSQCSCAGGRRSVKTRELCCGGGCRCGGACRHSH